MLALAFLLSACTPALNWRQVSVDTSGVVLLLPCKPDQATRTVTLRVADKNVDTHLSMHGCETSHLQFTLGRMAVPPGLSPDEAMQAWRSASLATIKAAPNEAVSQDGEMPGLSRQGQTARVYVATGEHQVQWLWFAYGNKIYQAAVYGHLKDKKLPEAAETYFSGIKLP